MFWMAVVVVYFEYAEQKFMLWKNQMPDTISAGHP